MTSGPACTVHEGEPLELLRADVDELVTRLAELDDDGRRRIPDLTVAVTVTDVGIVVTGRLAEGQLVERAEQAAGGSAPSADLRITTTAPVVHALVHHDLPFLTAWTSGQIGVRAGVGLLISLRRML